jgi:hypothetical protein
MLRKHDAAKRWLDLFEQFSGLRKRDLCEFGRSPPHLPDAPVRQIICSGRRGEIRTHGLQLPERDEINHINSIWKIFEPFWGKLESVSGFIGMERASPFPSLKPNGARGPGH